MIHFLDTSALVKRYRQEAGTEIIDEIFHEENNAIIICSLSMCEFIQAIDKHFRRKEIGLDDVRKVIDRFYSDIHNQKISIMEINQEILFRANDVILRHHLTTIDAIILGTVIGCRHLNPIFVCADTRSNLLKSAHEYHISTLNPLSPFSF